MPFRAVHSGTGESLVILDTDPPGRIRSLRELGANDLLRCPTCTAPMHVRAGAERVPHFAHKHRTDCPTNTDSPALMRGRLALYRWLHARLGDAVTIEHWVEGGGLPRPVDVVFERKRKLFAYWLFERGVRAAILDTLRDTLRTYDTTWVFLDAMRHDGPNPGELRLRPLERKLCSRGWYDQPYGGGGLHYLDAERSVLRTYRGLHLIHPPGLYLGVPVETPLADVLCSPRTGEPVHPGEHERARAHEEAEKQRAREEAERQRAREAEAARARRMKRGSPPPERGTRPPSARATPPPRSAAPGVSAELNLFKEPYECIICGTYTREWTTHVGATGKVKCRACVQAGRHLPDEPPADEM